MGIGIKLAGAGAAALLLSAAASAASPAEASQAPKPKVKLICKSVQDTGSMARRKRQCFTKQEWDRIAEAARARGQRLQSDMASGMSGN